MHHTTTVLFSARPVPSVQSRPKCGLATICGNWTPSLRSTERTLRIAGDRLIVASSHLIAVDLHPEALFARPGAQATHRCPPWGRAPADAPTGRSPA